MRREVAKTPSLPAPLPLLMIFGVSGGLLGLIDFLSTWFLGFGPTGGVGAALQFFLISVGYNFVWGVGLGAIFLVIMACFFLVGFRGWDREQVIYWRDIGIPRRLYGSLILAGLWAGLAFITVFQMAPDFGFSLLGDKGFLKPLSTSMIAALVGVFAVSLIVFTLVGWSRTHRRAALFFWFVGLIILGWQVFHAVYVVSYLAPIKYIHAMQAQLLIGMVAITGYFVLPGSLKNLKQIVHPLWLGGIVVVVLASPMLMGILIERSTKDSMRLILHERTVMTGRHLDMSVPMTGLNRPRGGSECELPEELHPSPNNCRGLSDQHSVDGVVLIVIDTLRGDRFDRKRDGQYLMPNLQEFGKQNHIFQRAYSSTASTAGSFDAMATGRVMTGDSFAGRELPDVLGDNEIWRGAIPAHPQFESFIEDFEYIDESIIDELDLRFGLSSEFVTEAGIQALEKSPEDEKFFLLIHYYDPHAYYVKNPRFNFGNSQVSRYDGEVAFTDHWLGKFLDELEVYQRERDIAVIVTSDHGEEFFDHRYSNHGVRLYEESVRIPMVADFPFGGECELCDEPVSLADLAPTISSLFGGDASPLADGSSLCLHGDQPGGKRPVFMRARSRNGVVYGDYKFIEETAKQYWQLYDLKEDPEEAVNLVDVKPDLASQMRCVLDTGNQ